LALVAVTPASTLAEWRRAESPNFIVYSDGSERSLREYTAKLERFDALLSARFGGTPPDARRLPVYLVSDARALRVAVPGLPAGIAGYYSTSENDIFAVLVRGESDDLLLHEYSHHIMSRSGDARYPGWLSEGFAEYFATATITEGGQVSLGLPNRPACAPCNRTVGCRWTSCCAPTVPSGSTARRVEACTTPSPGR